MRRIFVLVTAFAVSCSQNIPVPKLPRDHKAWREFRLPADASGNDLRGLLEAVDAKGHFTTLRKIFEFESEKEQKAVGKTLTRLFLNDSGEGLYSLLNHSVENGDIKRLAEWAEKNPSFKDVLSLARSVLKSESLQWQKTAAHIFSDDFHNLQMDLEKFLQSRPTKQISPEEKLAVAEQLKNIFQTHSQEVWSLAERIRAPRVVEALALGLLVAIDGRAPNEVIRDFEVFEPHLQRLGQFSELLASDSGELFSKLEKALSDQKSVSHQVAETVAKRIDLQSYHSLASSIRADLGSEPSYEIEFQSLRENIEAVVRSDANLPIILTALIACERLQPLFNASTQATNFKLEKSTIDLKRNESDFPLKDRLIKIGLGKSHDEIVRRYSEEKNVYFSFEEISGSFEEIVAATLKEIQIDGPLISSQQIIYAFLISGTLGFKKFDRSPLGDAWVHALSIFSANEFRRQADELKNEEVAADFKKVSELLVGLFPPESNERKTLEKFFEFQDLWPKLASMESRSDFLTQIQVFQQLLSPTQVSDMFSIFADLSKMGLLEAGNPVLQFVLKNPAAISFVEWLDNRTNEERDWIQSFIREVLRRENTEFVSEIVSKSSAPEIAGGFDAFMALEKHLNEDSLYRASLRTLLLDSDLEVTLRWLKRGLGAGNFKNLLNELLSALETKTLPEVCALLKYSADPRLQRLGALGEHLSSLPEVPILLKKMSHSRG